VMILMMIMMMLMSGYGGCSVGGETLVFYLMSNGWKT